MKQVNTALFVVLMIAALILCGFSFANANTTAININTDSTIIDIDTTCTRCEMTKTQFVEYISRQDVIYADSLIKEYFYVIDNSWYAISIESFDSFLRNHESVKRALIAKRKYGDLIELDDILDLD